MLDTAGPSRPEPPPDEQPGASFATQHDRKLRILIPVMVAMAFLMEQLDSTIITTAIPDIAASLGTTPVRLNAAVTTYVLTVAAFIPVSGWMADRFGARRIFVLALCIFTLGSMLCGMAQDLGTLLVMRVLQGLGGAMMTPVGRLILLRSFPRRELVTAMLYMTLPAVFGPVIGPLCGGILTTYLSWRWIFYVNIPFGLLGIALALRYVQDTSRAPRTRFDIGGFLLVGIGLLLLQFGIENISRPLISRALLVLVLAGAAVLLAAFAWRARRVAAPVVDLSLFRQRAFAIGTLVGGLCRIAINGVPFLLPLMFQLGFGMTPLASGALTFAISIGAILVRPAMSWLLRHVGFGATMIGGALGASILLAGFALIDAQMSRLLVLGYIFVFGLARSVLFMGSNTLAYADMPDDKLSRATTLGGILQQLSVGFGVSLSATLLGLVNPAGDALETGDFHTVFLIIAVIPLLAIPGFLRLRPEDGQQVSGYRLRQGGEEG